MNRHYLKPVVLLIAAIVSLQAPGQAWANAPSTNILAGKTQIKTSEMVAVNLGNGPTLIIWYWDASWYPKYPNEPSMTAYEIQTSPNSTNGTDGNWTTAVTVTGNIYGSRMHTIDFTGKSWVRMYHAGGLNPPPGMQIAVRDASQGHDDTWFFLGNSITGNCYWMGNTANFGTYIHDECPAFAPVFINGGYAGDNSGHGVTRIDAYLAANPDVKYWCIEYGTNDAWAFSDPPASFRANIIQIISKIKAAGRIPILAKIPYVETVEYAWFATIPLMNDIIDSLTEAGDMIKGPDLYTWSRDNYSHFPDKVHPDNVAADKFNRLWANAMMDAGLYGVTASKPSMLMRYAKKPESFTIAVNGRTVRMTSEKSAPFEIYTARGSKLASIIAAGNSEAIWQAPGPGMFVVRKSGTCDGKQLFIR